MNYDEIYEVAGKLREAIRREYESLKTFNVLILGKTGVGQSTLINRMFGERLADTGIGRPVTGQITKLTRKGFPLAIYDTPGFELLGKNDIESLFGEIRAQVRKGLESEDIGEAIHCLWYCVSAPSHRIERAELDFLRRFMDRSLGFQVPVIVLLTQSFSKHSAARMVEELEAEGLPFASIVPVLAEDYPIDDNYTVKAYGLDTLAEKMEAVIPEAIRNTFVAVQSVNLDLKRAKARSFVRKASMAAAATGAAPIPFADATVLVPEQIGMLAKITTIFGIPMERGARLRDLGDDRNRRRHDSRANRRLEPPEAHSRSGLHRGRGDLRRHRRRDHRGVGGGVYRRVDGGMPRGDQPQGSQLARGNQEDRADFPGEAEAQADEGGRASGVAAGNGMRNTDTDRRTAPVRFRIHAAFGKRCGETFLPNLSEIFDAPYRRDISSITVK